MLSKMKTPTVKEENEEVVDEVPNLLPPLGCFSPPPIPRPLCPPLKVKNCSSVNDVLNLMLM